VLYKPNEFAKEVKRFRCYRVFQGPEDFGTATVCQPCLRNLRLFWHEGALETGTALLHGVIRWSLLSVEKVPLSPTPMGPGEEAFLVSKGFHGRLPPWFWEVGNF
jgi:hypothetical protein